MWRMGAYFLIHRYWFAVGQVSLQRVFSAEAGSYVCETLSLINAVFVVLYSVLMALFHFYILLNPCCVSWLFLSIAMISLTSY